MNERRFRTFWANFVIASVLITVFAVAVLAVTPDEDKLSAVGGAIYGGNTQSNKVALMFNVYENAQNTSKIADILSGYDASATFFVGGSWAAKNPNTLLRLAAADFEIGNHGYLHRDHAKLSVRQNMDEITLTARLLSEVLGGLPGYTDSMLFASPSGSLGKAMFEACDRLGYRVIMWTRDTIDWRDHDSDLIFSRAVKDVKGGDLILMHPTDSTVEALPKVLAHIKAKGLVATSVSDVLAD